MASLAATEYSLTRLTSHLCPAGGPGPVCHRREVQPRPRAQPARQGRDRGQRAAPAQLPGQGPLRDRGNPELCRGPGLRRGGQDGGPGHDDDDDDGHLRPPRHRDRQKQQKELEVKASQETRRETVD